MEFRRSGTEEVFTNAVFTFSTLTSAMPFSRLVNPELFTDVEFLFEQKISLIKNQSLDFSAFLICHGRLEPFEVCDVEEKVCDECIAWKTSYENVKSTDLRR